MMTRQLKKRIQKKALAKGWISCPDIDLCWGFEKDRGKEGWYTWFGMWGPSNSSHKDHYTKNYNTAKEARDAIWRKAKKVLNVK